MEFQSEDIRRLYGSRLYIVPEIERTDSTKEQAEEEIDPSLLMQGSRVNWKLKPQSELAFVLTQEEFANRSLTSILRESVEAANIDLGKIGFGILEGQGPGWDFQQMPVKVALVCHDFGQKWPNPLPFQDKQLYFSPTLQAVQENATDKQALHSLLQSIQASLHS